MLAIRFASWCLVPLLALPALVAHAAAVGYGDVVVLTGSSVIQLERARGYAPSPLATLALYQPRAVDVAPDGRVFVLDQGVVSCCGFPSPAYAPIVDVPSSIREIAPNGVQRAFSPLGPRRLAGNGEEFDEILLLPLDFSLGPDGLLYVADPAYERQRMQGFDGRVARVDPVSGSILEPGGGGTQPRYLDIAPTGSGALQDANLRALFSNLSFERVATRYCDGALGCGNFVLYGGDMATLADGRVVVFAHENAADFIWGNDPLPVPFGDANLSDLIVFDASGLVLQLFVDIGFASSRHAGGAGDELFFTDSPTSIARFDLRSGTWATVFDAGEPIFDLAVQQVPEPGSLSLLAAALGGVALAARRARSVAYVHSAR